MKGTRLLGIVAAGAFALALTGCSLPGISFNGKPKMAENSIEGFTVQPITPSLLSAQAANREAADIGRSNVQLRTAITDYAYVVEPQDVLAVTVWGHPELSAGGSLASVAAAGGIGQSGVSNGFGQLGGNSAMAASRASAGESGFTVDSDGSIFFPYVGRVQVAGHSVPEVRDILTKAISKIVVNAQVSVSVVGFNSQTYELAGSIKKPGLYPITNVPVTVSQAIQNAGGILQTIPNVTVGTKASATPLADLAHVLYIHDGKRETLNLRAFFENGDLSQDRLLHAGDIIQVPNNTYDEVHLIGEIASPGDYPLNNGTLNLAAALGRAGGLNLETANPSRIFIFRGSYTKPQIFWLDARSPVTMLLATQFQLQPQDVIYVATAGITTWNRIITQILPTVSLLNQAKQITQ